MNTTLTAIPGVPGTNTVTRSRRANARLAPGSGNAPGNATPRSPKSRQADRAAQWQRILDLLDPDKRCGAWSAAAFEGRPVVCTGAPHDRREEHANAETGWRWHEGTPRRHPV